MKVEFCYVLGRDCATHPTMWQNYLYRIVVLRVAKLGKRTEFYPFEVMVPPNHGALPRGGTHNVPIIFDKHDSTLCATLLNWDANAGDE